MSRRATTSSGDAPSGGSDDVFTHYPGSSYVVSLLADKWTIPVLHTLSRGARRTGALRRALSGVSQKMLTQTLRRLVDHGLIERTVRSAVPPRVEYGLTALGSSINAPIAQLCEWTKQNGATMERVLARGRKQPG